MAEINRREFAGAVALAALAPVLGIGVVATGADWRRAVAGVAADGDLDAIAKALADVVRTQYGRRLGDAELAIVTRQIRSTLDRAEAMRKVELANGDEPDFIFSATRIAAS